MASMAPEPESRAQGMTIEPKEGPLAKSSSSEDGSVENGKVGKPSYTTKEVQDGPKHISGHWKSFLGQGALASISMFGIAVALLVFVIPFNLDLFNVHDLSPEHYFFLRKIPTSAIICISSLASLLSILIIPSLLKLSSFNHAHEVLVNSVSQDHSRLPTTQDFAILLRALAGSPHAFVQGCRRSVTKPTSGRRFIRKVTGLYAAALLLSITIIASNFAICTLTRGLQVPFEHQNSSDVTDYGRALPPGCLQSPASNICQTRADLHGSNNTELFWTMKGLSDENKIVPLDFNGLSNFYNESVMILADARAPKGSSYTATTYGVSTMFMPIGADCVVTAQSWNCSDHHFDGNFTTGLTIPKSTSLILQDNVIKWVVAVKVDGQAGWFDSFLDNSDFSVDQTSSFLATVMHCETSVWEIEYLKLGEEYIPQSYKAVNESTAQLVYGPAFPGLIDGYDGFNLIDLATEFNAKAVQSNIHTLAHNWAESFARLAISSSAGLMQHIPSTKHFSTITAVPQSPLILLGIASFLYGVLVLALFLNAIRVAATVRGVRDVQARMGISGLVSVALEPEKSDVGVRSLEELLGDDTSVCVYQTGRGGYKWECGKME